MIRNAFQKQAELRPDSVALIDRGERISFGSLASRKNAIAGYLAGKRRLARGDLVAVALPNCWEFAASFLAVAELGAIFMPFNTHWRARELDAFLPEFPPTLVITSRELREPWDSLREILPQGCVISVVDPPVQEVFRTASPPSSPRIPPEELADDPVLYLITSGSTGKPKVAPRSQRNLAAGVENVAQTLGVRPEMRFLSVVPFYHANGFSNCLLLPLLSGAAAVLAGRFSPVDLVETVRREKIQVLIGSPFIFRMLTERSAPRDAFSSVEICLSSGASMPAALPARCAGVLGLKVRQLYGSSEAGTISIEPAPGGQGGSDVGLPVKSVEIRILDGSGRILAAGETGEIAVKGPAMMRGYAGQPGQDSRLFQDGLLRTGDLGRIDGRNHLILCGRAKRLINLSGVKVDPAEIEEVLLSHPSVRRCRVAGVRNPRGQELIKAVIAVRPSQRLSREQVVEHCRRRLSEYKIPRIIDFVETMPEDSSGKTPAAWPGEENELSET